MFLLDNCTMAGITFDMMIPKIISLIIMIIQIAVPIILVIMGMLDLGKAVLAQKEDEIKKGQGLFVKRLIAAVVVFLVVVVVKLVIGIVAPNDNETNMWNVFDCMTSGSCACGEGKKEA